MEGELTIVLEQEREVGKRFIQNFNHAEVLGGFKKLLITFLYEDLKLRS